MSKFDRVMPAEVSIDFRQAGARLEAKAAFINTATGRTHGWTNMTAGWSKTTYEALRQLQEAMAADLHRVHFDGEYAPQTSTQDGSQPTEPLGLAGHLADGANQL